jgi:hypothetical protein
LETALEGKWLALEHCAHQPLMHVAIEQFRTRRPYWWVVGGAVVVPIWAVELVKRGHGNTFAGAYLELAA